MAKDSLPVFYDSATKQSGTRHCVRKAIHLILALVLLAGYGYYSLPQVRVLDKCL